MVKKKFQVFFNFKHYIIPFHFLVGRNLLQKSFHLQLKPLPLKLTNLRNRTVQLFRLGFYLMFFFSCRDDWQTAVKPSRQPAAALVKNCFFRLTIVYVPTDLIVFQLEPALAPIVSAKFVDICNSKIGYRGSQIFKVFYYYLFLFFQNYSSNRFCYF